MADIVLGLGTSHSPQLNLGPEFWGRRGEEDRRNPWLFRVPEGAPVTYEELLAEADPAIQKELTADVFQRRHEANQRGIGAVAHALGEASLDVLIMVGDDQKDLFDDDNTPALAIYFGEQIPYIPRAMRPGTTMATSMSDYPQEPMQFPCASELALHLIGSLMEQGVDVAHSKFFREGQSVPNAWGFVYHRMMKSEPIPTVLVLQNTYYPPAQPTPKRSYEYGLAIRNAVESWNSNARVGVLASGGMSHFVVDEELDRAALRAMRGKDAAALTSLPRERLQSGTSEIRNWITVAGAAQHLDMELFDYVPCYRSPAGTGCGMAFARWC